MSQSSIPPSNESFSFRMIENNATCLLVVPCDDEEQLNSIPGWNNVTTDEEDHVKNRTNEFKRSTVDSLVNLEPSSSIKPVSVSLYKGLSRCSEISVDKSTSTRKTTLQRSSSLSNLNMTNASFKFKNSVSMDGNQIPSLEESSKKGFRRSLPNIKLSACYIEESSALQKFKNLLLKTKKSIGQIKDSLLREQVSPHQMPSLPASEREQVPLNGIKRPLGNSVECSKPKFFKFSEVSGDLKNLIGQGLGSVAEPNLSSIGSAVARTSVESIPGIESFSKMCSVNSIPEKGVFQKSIAGFAGGSLLSSAQSDLSNFSSGITAVPRSPNIPTSAIGLHVAAQTNVPSPNAASCPINMAGSADNSITPSSASCLLSKELGVNKADTGVLGAFNSEVSSVKSTVPLRAPIASLSANSTVPLPSLATNISTGASSKILAPQNIPTVSPSYNIGPRFIGSVPRSTVGELGSDMSNSQIARHLNTSILSLNIIGNNNNNTMPIPQVQYRNSLGGANSVVNTEVPVVKDGRGTDLCDVNSTNLNSRVEACGTNPSGLPMNVLENTEPVPNLSNSINPCFPTIQLTDVYKVPSDSSCCVQTGASNVSHAVDLSMGGHFSSTPVDAQLIGTTPYPQVAENLTTEDLANVTVATGDMDSVSTIPVPPEIVISMNEMSREVPQIYVAEKQSVPSANDAVGVSLLPRAVESNADVSNYKVGDETQKACVGIADDFMSTGSFRSNDRTLSQKDHSSTYTVNPPAANIQGSNYSPMSSAELFTSQQERSGGKEANLPNSCLRRVGKAQKKLSFADGLEQGGDVHAKIDVEGKHHGKRKRSDSEEAGHVDNLQNDGHGIGEDVPIFRFNSAQVKEMTNMLFSLLQ